MRQRAALGSCWRPALGLTLMLAGCEQATQPPTDIPRPASGSTFEPETTDAFEAAISVLQAHPGPGQWASLAALYHAHEQLDPAISCYHNAIAAGDVHSRTAHLLALALDEVGERASAIEQVRRATTLDPPYPPSFWRLGQWLLEAGEPDGANQAMNALVRMAPRETPTMLAAGKFLLDTGDATQAVRVLAGLLKQDPGHRYAHYLMGLALRQTGQDFHAKAHLELGRHAQPHWPDPYKDHLTTLLTGPYYAFVRWARESDNGNAQEALPHLVALESRLGTAPYYEALCKTYRRLDMPALARQALDKGLAVSPVHDGLSIQAVGLICDAWTSRNGGPGDETLIEALAIIDTSLERNPASADSHAARAQVLESLDRLDESSAAWQKADEFDRHHRKYGFRAARVFLKHEHWASAVPVLQKLVDRFPYDVPMLRELGLAQFHAGQLADAEETLVLYQGRNPDDSTVNAAVLEMQSR